MRQNTWFYIGGSGLDRTDDFQKFGGSGLDRIQFFADQEIRIGLRLKNLSVRSSLTATIDEHGSGLDRTGSGLTPISAGTRLQFFWKLADRTGSDWENFWCFCAIILNISKILVVIWFYRFAKWQCIFCHQWQKLWWDYFAIRTVGYPPLSIHNVEF